MLLIIIVWALSSLVTATPPACFLSCINEIAAVCPSEHMGFRCICGYETKLVECLVDICPYGSFESARDHYLGTCMEHGMPTKTNPFPPPPLISSDRKPPGKHIAPIHVSDSQNTPHYNTSSYIASASVFPSRSQETSLSEITSSHEITSSMEKINIRKLQDLKLDGNPNVQIIKTPKNSNESPKVVYNGPYSQYAAIV